MYFLQKHYYYFLLGVEHGVLAMYQSRFICDTRGAGAGQLTVRIRGPKGKILIEYFYQGIR